MRFSSLYVCDTGGEGRTTIPVATPGSGPTRVTGVNPTMSSETIG